MSKSNLVRSWQALVDDAHNCKTQTQKNDQNSVSQMHRCRQKHQGDHRHRRRRLRNKNHQAVDDEEREDNKKRRNLSRSFGDQGVHEAEN